MFKAFGSDSDLKGGCGGVDDDVVGGYDNDDYDNDDDDNDDIEDDRSHKNTFSGLTNW